MKDKAVVSVGPSDACGVSLRLIWNVEADKRYTRAVTPKREGLGHAHPLEGRGTVCVRTYAGEGRVTLLDGQELHLEPQSLVFLQWSAMQHYQTYLAPWRFLWFEFQWNALPPFPFHHVLEVPVNDDEKSTTVRILKRLASRQVGRRQSASALFLAQVHGWLAEAGEENIDTPERRRIYSAIKTMRETLDRPFSVQAMARTAHMSERTFRNAFTRVTGQPPKRYRDELRMAAAQELLRTGQCNVSETADRLGYSSPYHFSRAFSTHFGVAPSILCPRHKREP